MKHNVAPVAPVPESTGAGLQAARLCALSPVASRLQCFLKNTKRRLTTYTTVVIWADTGATGATGANPHDAYVCSRLQYRSYWSQHRSRTGERYSPAFGYAGHLARNPALNNEFRFWLSQGYWRGK